MTPQGSAAEMIVARPPIRLRILGPIDLCDSNGQPVNAVLAQPRRLGLLAYLTLASWHGFIRRDQALAMFWPEHDMDRARAALNRSIYYLRQALGDDAVVSRGIDEVAVSTDRVWCDATALQVALAARRFDEAIGLYRGELLEGLFVTGAAGFERWVEDERQRLATAASRAAWLLAEEAERTANHADAARLYQCAVDRSPLNELGVQRLIAALDRAGDRSGAVIAFDRFADRLATELELHPAPETRALVDAIRDRESAVIPHRLVSDAARPVDRDAPSVARVSRETVGVAMPFRLRSPSRRQTLAFVAVGVTIIAGIVAVSRRHVPPLDRHHVAVLSLRTSPEGVALDTVNERIGGSIRDAIVENGDRADLVPIMSGRSRGVDERNAQRAAREAGAGILVIATVHRAGDTVVADARIIETAGNLPRWVVHGVARSPASMQPLDTIAQRVAGAIAALTDSRFGTWLPIAAAIPPTVRAFEEFDRATELRLRNRPGEALGHYEAAVVLDPTFTWAMMEAAVAHMNIGDRPGADSVIDLVAAQRDRLTRVQGHWLDWMLAVRDEDWVRSYAALERAAQLLPDRFLYGLAENARWLNRPRRSVELLTRLGPNSLAGGGFGYWYLMADSYHQLGDHRQELEVARRARQRHPQRPTAIIVEARARAALGDVAGVLALVDTILALPRDGRDTPGTLMLQSAQELRAHGHAAAGLELTNRAIRWFAGRTPGEARSLETRRQFARAVYDAGRWSLADSLFRELVSDDRDGSVDHRAMLGAIAAHRGDTTEARRCIVVLQQLAHSANRPREDAIFGQARVMAVLGNASESVRLLREALGGQGQDLHTELDFAGLAADPAFRAFVRPKG